MSLTPIETGKVPGYEDYHGEIFNGSEIVGGWNYDKKADVFIGSFKNQRKNFYHKTVIGMIKKMENFLDNQPKQ